MFEIRTYDGAGRRVFWVPMGGNITIHQYTTATGPYTFSLTDFIQHSPDVRSRPYHRQEGWFYQLIDEIHNWLTEQGYTYVIDYRWMAEGVGWAVGLHDETAAVAYRLRWSTQEGQHAPL